MKNLFKLIISSTLFLLSVNSFADKVNHEPKLAVVTLSADIHLIQAELAASPAEREKGLMYRKKLPENYGMLFVFENDARQCFWMKNTLLPLSIAFIDKNNVITNIEEMQANSLDQHCSKLPVRYALEMNKAWFDNHGITPGKQIRGIPTLN